MAYARFKVNGILLSHKEPQGSDDWAHLEFRVLGGSRNASVSSTTWWPGRERTPGKCFSDYVCVPWVPSGQGHS